MTESHFLETYASLLVSYCLRVALGQKVLIRSTLLAEPLIRKIYQKVLEAGGYPEVQFSFESEQFLFYTHAHESQLSTISSLYQSAVNSFDCILTIMAPYDVYETQGVDSERKKTHQLAFLPVRKLFSKRSAEGTLKWCLCVYPTEAAAMSCGMNLSEYQHFVFSACKLYEPDPEAAWKALSLDQEKMVRYLNSKSKIRFVSDQMDISFSTKNRRWINSDGKRNMPSGEVFTSPLEKSGSGFVYFSCPTLYDHQDVEGVYLEVSKGYITSWSAKVGQSVLDEVFQLEGSRYFGEIAIGTNTAIQTVTKNILFDEKISGTIHMAVGNSYKETGGKNVSVVHWDLITDMKKSGRIFADGELFYEYGSFLPFVLE